MSIGNEIQKLGIKSLSEQLNIPNEGDINVAQKAYGRELPKAYLDLIRKYGECITSGLWGIAFPKPMPLYVDSSPGALPVAPLDYAGFGGFFGGNGADGSRCGLSYHVRVFVDRMPNGFLAIGDDLFGNMFCLGYSPDGNPGVFFWDHEFEWDVDDYEAETGKKMPEIVKYQNIYFIADTFEEFLRMMQEEEDSD